MRQPGGRSKHADGDRLVRKLHTIRTKFSSDAEEAKVTILQALGSARLTKASTLQKLHDTLCYLVAFPDSAAVHRACCEELTDISTRVAKLTARQRDLLSDTGIAGTQTYYRYGYDQALWLTHAYPEDVTIDWDEFDRSEMLDDLLGHLIEPSQEEYFLSGDVSTQEWLQIASQESSNGCALTDLGWLMKELRRRKRNHKIWEGFYDTADVPVCWRLGDGDASITQNRNNACKTQYRRNGMRRLTQPLSAVVTQPHRGIRRVPRNEAALFIELARKALAVRHRNVFSMDHANPAETYVASLGCGTQAAIFGITADRRPLLEGNFGYLLLSNGVPIGYGGASPLFQQVNTGINLFDQYRRSEARFLFAQLLRVFRMLFRNRFFVVNPYQFGKDNSEALGSGAFWFYYRLGFKPVDAKIARKAQVQWNRIRKDPAHRTDHATLRSLCESDLVLRLPGARVSDFFHEQWLTTCSAGATSVIHRQAGQFLHHARTSVAKEVATRLGVRSTARWSKEDREALRNLAPMIMLAKDLESWPTKEKKLIERAIRLHGKAVSLESLRLMQNHKRFQKSLASYCNAHRT